MRIRSTVFLLLLLYGCRSVQIKETKDLIAFGSGNLDIYFVNVNDKTVSKLISSFGDVAYHSPFWLNEKHLGFLFFHNHVTTKTKFPLGVYNVTNGRVKTYNPGVNIYDYAARYTDSSVIYTNYSEHVSLLQISSLNSKEIVNMLEFGLRRDNHFKVLLNKRFIIFAAIDSIKYKFLPRYPTGFVNLGSDTLDDIYVYNISEKTLTQLTNTNCCDRDPTWSPDGEHIAFSSNRTGNFEIYVMDKDGKNVKQLTDNPAEDTDPEYSPDGNKIAFISNRNGNDQIWLMKVDASEIKQLTNLEEEVAGPLSWSPAK